MEASQGQNPLSNNFLTVRALPLSLDFPVFPIPAMRLLHLWVHRHRQEKKEGSRIQGSYLKFVPQQLVHNLLFFICCLAAELGEGLDPPLLVFSLTEESSRGIAPTHFPPQPGGRVVRINAEKGRSRKQSLGNNIHSGITKPPAVPV